MERSGTVEGCHDPLVAVEDDREWLLKPSRNPVMSSVHP